MRQLFGFPSRVPPLTLGAAIVVSLLGASVWVGAVQAGPGRDLSGAIELPLRAQALRAAGVAEPEVQGLVKAAGDAGLDAGEGEDLLAATEDAVNERGPIDNLGAFVQSELSSGKRGKELADSIHAEHERRGKGGKGGKSGKGKAGEREDGAGGPPEHSKAGGKAGDHEGPPEHAQGNGPPEHSKAGGNGGGHGSSSEGDEGAPGDARGKSEGKGKSESKGKSDNNGQSSGGQGSSKGKGKGGH
jgi:hypothetical protein